MDRMDITDDGEGTGGHVLHLVTPGETVTGDAAFMKGHGTVNDGADLVATVVGTVERINKLISVRPFRARYAGDIGDVVVGRICEVTQKRWKDGMLLLAAVNLPGGELRRRSESDELQMRQLLAEGDMISAEIQAFFGDGAVSLHTRSLKYGKLKSGSLVTVPSSLVNVRKLISCIILLLKAFTWMYSRNERIHLGLKGNREYGKEGYPSTTAGRCRCSIRECERTCFPHRTGSHCSNFSINFGACKRRRIYYRSSHLTRLRSIPWN
ncbi:hypothetical protein BCR33DRAFT_756920 [Rhizoclosmatium globosum]|uniref:Uncharacterized protein n=1 Tax=Rhizoclosmatium globosum TaxID=329046 RepID=A0A1Y2D156_9FUNG|nr:hypothetical protein BCR33DRAFT_756920 [Rhizoclosmatium globosum]|eukprot:ORY52980.1 hypothetical protein BCR33DRAFT_756920 [Rhizoclosmatium globosum]